MNDNDLIRGPKWRTRTAPQHRALAAVVTFAVVVVIGLFVLVLATWLLDRLGAPWWLTTLPWWLPTIGAVVWTLTRPAPAVATDDDDSWTTYSVCHVLVGEDSPRPAALRVIAAVLFGAPVVWALGLFGLLAAVGLFEL